MHMSTVYDYKKGVFLVEPVVAELEEAVCGFEMCPDCLLWGGGYLCAPALCVRADSTLPVLFCAKVSL